MAMQPEELALVRQWWQYAAGDLAVAEHLMTMVGCDQRIVCYHAQQAVEKALKALLVLRGVDFPFTHNINRLRELCAPATNWVGDVDDADELTKYGTTARYPGIDYWPDEGETKRAVEIAARVVALVRGSLGDEGLDI